VDRLPVLPLGRIVVYPHVVLPMALTDPHAVQLIDEVVQGNKRLLLGVVRPLGGTEPPEGAVMHARAEELYEVGTLGTVVRMLKLGDGSVRVMVQGLERARLVEVIPAEHWLVAGYEPLPNTVLEDARTEALKRTVHAQFSRVIDIAPYLGEELHEVLVGISDAGKLADFVAANLDLALPAKAELLAIDEVNRRLERLAELLGQELQVLEVGSQIQEKVRTRLDQNQREYVLREQLRVIRQELGEEEGEDELTELAGRLEAAGLHDEAKKVVDRELKRLRQMSPQSAEYHVARTYLEVIASLPWGRTSEDRLDLKAARDILDRDHYDLKPVKERILEYLAVRTLNPAARGGILCFVGPPGVGKTSLGQSIAEALGRRFTRVSLGGVRDEAEVRGHRRTYVGALPGRIIHALQRCETRNPLLMLDEVDKMGADVRGDPTASCSSPRATASRPSPTHCSTGWKCSPCPGTRPGRSSRSPSATSCRASSKRRGCRWSGPASPMGRSSGSSGNTRARPACASSSGRSRACSARPPSRWWRDGRRPSRSRRRTSRSSPASPKSRARWRDGRPRSGWRPGSHGRPWAATSCSSRRFRCRGRGRSP